MEITGWMSGPELIYLAELAANSKLIVEAGSFQGRSTKMMADHTNGIIHAVDPWKPVVLLDSVGVDSQTYTRFALNLNKHIKSGRVIPHAKKFTDFWIDNPDLIFIDAMHDYESVKRDILHAKAMMTEGIISGHDYSPTWQGVIKAVHEIFRAGKIKVVDTIWSVEINNG